MVFQAASVPDRTAQPHSHSVERLKHFLPKFSTYVRQESCNQRTVPASKHLLGSLYHAGQHSSSLESGLGQIIWFPELLASLAMLFLGFVRNAFFVPNEAAKAGWHTQTELKPALHGVAHTGPSADIKSLGCTAVRARNKTSRLPVYLNVRAHGQATAKQTTPGKLGTQIAC